MKAVFIGAGRRALRNAHALVASGAGEVAGFWNRTPEAAEAAAVELGVTAFATIEDMVEETQPDLAVIATHPAFRVEPIGRAVAAGCQAIAVEKPVALTPAELADAERAAAGVFLAVNTQYQWMPHWRQVLAAVAAGRLGRVVSINATTAVGLLDQGTHLLSLVVAVLQAAGQDEAADWVLAGAAGETRYGGVAGPEEIVALIGYGDARVWLSAGRVSPVPPQARNRFHQQRVFLQGTEGAANVTLAAGGWLQVDTEREVFDTAWPRDDESAQAAFWTALARAVQSPELAATFPTRLDASARQTRTLFAVIESAKCSRRVWLRPQGGCQPDDD